MIPRTQDCRDVIAGAKLFITLDMTSTCNQIPVHDKDILKTVFTTKYGLFEYTTMPLGLCNAPTTFQRVMEIAMAGMQWTCCLAYLDDVVIYLGNIDEHIEIIKHGLPLKKESWISRIYSNT